MEYIIHLFILIIIWVVLWWFSNVLISHFVEFSQFHLWLQLKMFLCVCVCVCARAHSVVSNSLRPRGLQSTRFLYLLNFPGKNTGAKLPFPTPGDLDPGTESVSLVSPALAGDSFSLCHYFHLIQNCSTIFPCPSQHNCLFVGLLFIYYLLVEDYDSQLFCRKLVWVF